MTDVVFLYHPHTYETNPSAQLGLGLLSLATYLDTLGVDVRVINAQALTVAEAIALVPRCRVLALYGCLVDGAILTVIARSLRGGAADRVVIGGPIGRSPEALDMDAVDHLVDGFGEDVLWELVQGVSFPKCISVTSLLKNINAYPYPNRALVEGSLGGSIFHEKAHREDVLSSSTILTSRGCRYRCAFCMSGVKSCSVADYDRQRIEAEVAHCVELGIRALRVSDDNIINDPERLKWFCGLMNHYGLVWRGSIRVHPASLEMYRLMRDNGCQELSFGIESGDQHVLNVLRKGIRVEWNTKAVRLAREAGIVVRALMMMCTPGETRATLQLNKQWVAEAKPDVVSMKVFVPYPGTPIHSDPTKYGAIIDGAEDFNNSSYRPDGSLPASHLSLIGGMSKAELTEQFMDMRRYIEEIGAANHG